MYHVRFFKVPSIRKQNGYEIKAVLTLTNDLGDHFFFGEADIIVTIQNTRLRKVLKWTAGSQSATVEFQTPRIADKELIMEASVDQSTVVDYLNDPEDRRAEYFLPLTSIPILVPTAQKQQIQSEKYDIRKIGPLEMLEETGHSIAKKVWDGGIVTSLFLQQNPDFIKPHPKAILELGTGCGLVGLMLARIYNTRVLVTDLEDAQEICEKNLVRDGRVKFDTLDWEQAEKLDTEWDLVIATDCTYNSDSFEPLLVALDTLVVSSKTTIIIGHKYRNSSEEGFFEKFASRFNVLSDQRIDMFGESVRLVKANKKAL